MFRSFNRILFAVAALLLALLAAVAMSAPPAASADPSSSAPQSPSSVTPTESTTPVDTPTSTTPTPAGTPSSTPSSSTTPSPSTSTPPETGVGTVSVNAIDLTSNALVGGVTVTFQSGDVTKSVTTPVAGDAAVSTTMPAGTVSASVSAFPGRYRQAWIDPASATLAAGGKASFIVSLVRKGPAGFISITKRDRVTGEPLAGAKFRVSTARGNGSAVLVTGADGVGTAQVPPGGYNITEVGAPAGYLLDPTVRFVWVESSRTRNLELYNTPIDAPVVHRHPDGRVPLSSIPTGRTH